MRDGEGRGERGGFEWVEPSGLAVAGIAFAITRTFVTEAIEPTTLQYLVTGVVPLIGGLALTAYGVALAVGGYPTAYVRIVAGWVVAGTLSMVVVLGVSTFDATMGGGMGFAVAEAPVLFANVLLGGAVGGALTGRRSARNHVQRQEIRRHANRSALVTRILRHEVVNAATIADGYAGALGEDHGDDVDETAVAAIREAATRIVDTVEDVGDITDDRTLAPIDLGDVVADALEDVDAGARGVELDASGASTGVVALADGRLEFLLAELVRNAIENRASAVEVTTRNAQTAACVAVRDDGTGLPDAQRRLLEAGEFPEYDDPSTGFGLKIVRLLVRRYGGSIAVEPGIDGEGTSIVVELPHATATGDARGVLGVSAGALGRGTAAGVLAGVAMGGVFLSTNDVLPVIGSLYGVQNPVVGWVTHLFHSVVFALAALPGFASLRRTRGTLSVAAAAVAGVAWGSVLWLVAAGFVMPLWLRAVGIGASFPNLPLVGLLAHVVWGVVFGGAYEWLERRWTEST
jgi:two-component system OmpR family sensor kinase